jgi:hypothetical protein
MSKWVVERILECKPCIAEHFKTDTPLPCIKCEHNAYIRHLKPASISVVKS